MEKESTTASATMASNGAESGHGLDVWTKSVGPLAKGKITVTRSENEACMITQDNDPANPRARMPCGHTICKSPLSIFDILISCHNQVASNFHVISVLLFDYSMNMYKLIMQQACILSNEMLGITMLAFKNDELLSDMLK